MRTQEISIYKFSELPEDTQEKVIEHFREGDQNFWSKENEETLKAFEEFFPVKIKDWEYGVRNYINFTLTCDETIEPLTGVRLLKYILNNYGTRLFKPKYLKHVKGKARYSRINKDTCCVLTGYCIDDDTLQPIYDFLKTPSNSVTLQDLMNDCLHAWVFACRRDYEHAYSDEAIKETIDANEYEFTEEGKLI
jgi:hypothetical protein